VTGQRVPVVARPRRLTRVCWLVAALVVVVFGVLAVALGRGPEGDAQFRLPDQIAFFCLGLIIAGVTLLFTRARVEGRADGVHVRNPFGTKDVPWQVVREVRLDEGSPGRCWSCTTTRPSRCSPCRPTTATRPSTSCSSCARC
jgi:hypothetical protein